MQNHDDLNFNQRKSGSCYLGMEFFRRRILIEIVNQIIMYISNTIQRTIKYEVLIEYTIDGIYSQVSCISIMHN
jgi:hypothetical protein